MGFKFNTLLRAILAGGSVPQPLRFAAPENYAPFTPDALVVAPAGYTNIRTRMPFTIGSGDLSDLVLSFNGWYYYYNMFNMPNDFSIVKCSIERDGVAYTPVTFGGSRTKVIAAGDIDIQSDAILPSAFGLGNFALGTKFWIRLEYSVASVGMTWPTGGMLYSRARAGALSVRLGAGNDVAAVDAFGAMTYTTGVVNQARPYNPIVLGRFASGDPKTVIGIGDSILDGVGDTLSGYSVRGFGQALFDADHVSNPIGGANFGLSGGTSAYWAGAGSDRLTSYLKYAKYALDENETNRINGNTQLATAQSETLALWSACASNGINSILRTKLIPRTSGADGTLPNTAYSSGGAGRLFNDWLDTPGLGTAEGVALTLLPVNSLRIGTDQATDDFYRWAGATSGNLGPNNGDGTHPNAAGSVLMAGDYRAGIATLP